ncbi:6-methylsalicylic acid decarboxylase [Paramyrothecium foliicola]|nr:6-methylsalicylic acid decarboxylase [Paramyrothecium foliicola]
MGLQRIDVHHHFVPQFLVDALLENGGDPAGWTIPQWTVEKDLKFNEDENTAFTFLSITAPGAGILPLERQPSFCRQANTYAAEVRAAHPDRYGFFATIPSLLDMPAAINETTYALDTLQADGVILYTRYGAGNHYLGHPDFRELWDFLDARGTVVFIHPTHPVDTALVNPSLPQPMIDYTHETTRTSVDLIMSGTIRSHPNVKIILPHGGGTLPYLALRPAAMLPYLPPVEGQPNKTEGKSPMDITNQFMEDARSFYFDTALSAAPLTLSLLKEFAQPDHILFGSDYPYAPTPAIKLMNEWLEKYKSKDQRFVQSVDVGAALKLFPRLGKLFKKELASASL